MNNPLSFLIRRLTRRIGWEITGAIENVIFSIVIGIVIMCCCGFGVLAVAWQIIFKQ